LYLSITTEAQCSQVFGLDSSCPRKLRKRTSLFWPCGKNIQAGIYIHVSAQALRHNQPVHPPQLQLAMLIICVELHILFLKWWKCNETELCFQHARLW